MSTAGPIARTVGARLRELRLDAELSQGDIAERMGSYVPIVSRIERGCGCNLFTLCAYTRALELDLGTVLEPLSLETILEAP